MLETVSRDSSVCIRLGIKRKEPGEDIKVIVNDRENKNGTKEVSGLYKGF